MGTQQRHGVAQTQLTGELPQCSLACIDPGIDPGIDPTQQRHFAAQATGERHGCFGGGPRHILQQLQPGRIGVLVAGAHRLRCIGFISAVGDGIPHQPRQLAVVAIQHPGTAIWRWSQPPGIETDGADQRIAPALAPVVHDHRAADHHVEHTVIAQGHVGQFRRPFEVIDHHRRIADTDGQNGAQGGVIPGAIAVAVTRLRHGFQAGLGLALVLGQVEITALPRQPQTAALGVILQRRRITGQPPVALIRQ